MTGDGERSLVIWLLSDIQPRTRSEWSVFENAVDDVNRHFERIEMAVIAGDLLKSRASEESFAWFLRTRSRARVDHWYEIAGNHDVRTGARFRHYFPGPPHRAVAIGNILLLLLADESTASRTDLSPAAFHWWRDQVHQNQDRILITVTHAQLRQSGLLGSFLPSRRINDSQRFAEVLRSYHVSMWFSGHTHLPHGLSGTSSQLPEFGNTSFINVSSIDESLFFDSQSRFLFLMSGSDQAWIRSRNHSESRFNPSLDIRLQLPQPFVWDGGQPQVVDGFPE